ncbi:TetR/AcrR family transcriptional regulator [Mycolicibacterium elephantis]|uniref:TetR family transcriptional regulator n=1 Tax=Mycolicibacterium elephantis DSM 44368 TaxID=1335622 RepID=A0A439DXC4_9MYCO|nr:TetR/AcrR family transcriptional regulator [Mycolicibacterium elephantis]MCV7222005.1 TetR/AcrR family transcriptional regulator [Mycolicibacterium elephantis]RWA21984.1 TetR family transcriptional regulator [Mycolicibacterium elephantis DSM 44368]
MSDPLPRALEILWSEPGAPRRSAGLSRERIVAAAIELADADGLGALSMARLAERLGCGTMSLYRHIANKDELVTFMLSEATGLPPNIHSSDWRAALDDWATGLWSVYHRHPWILQATAAGPPADPGQLRWLEAGLAALGETGMSERDKFAAVMVVLHFVRGAAAVHIEAAHVAGPDYPALLRRVIDEDRFPALSAALADGVLDDADNDREADFRSGLRQLLDGIATRVRSK